MQARPMTERHTLARCAAPLTRAPRRQVFAVRCYEVGPDQLATMVTVANLLQEVAANHAQELWGEGVWAPALMTEQDLAFALSKLHIRMDAPLRWCAAPGRALAQARGDLQPLPSSPLCLPVD